MYNINFDHVLLMIAVGMLSWVGGGGGRMRASVHTYTMHVYLSRGMFTAGVGRRACMLNILYCKLLMSLE